MSYIGRQISNLSDRVKLDAITASATATYNLLLNTVAYVPSSAESLTVSLNGVIQAPQDSYTVSGSTITFASTLSASDSIDFILAERSITLQTPSSGSVNTEQLASGSVTAPKLSSTAVDNTNTNSTLITAQTEKTSLVDADKFLISDSAASGALKYVQKSNLPSGGLVHINTISITSSTADATFLHGTNGVVLNDGTYENFLIIGSGIQVSTDDDSIRVSFSVDNGSNYNAQTYRATDQIEMTQSGSTGTASTAAQSSLGATSLAGAVGNNLGNGFMFTMYLFNLNSVVVKKTALVEALEEQYNLIYKKRSSFITIAEYNQAIDGIRFNCNAGTFSKATFRLYGITNG